MDLANFEAMEMLDNKDQTHLKDVGEFGLIDLIAASVQLHHTATIKGIGDDAAVIDPAGEKVVVTTDILTEGIHFDPVYTPMKHLGYKAVVVNLSDLCAMNVVPKQITVSIAVSSKYTLEAIEALYEGINLACEIYKVDLVGGDTTSALQGLTISITAIGYGREENIVYRKGAKLHNLVCVSGDLGAAYAGLQILEREKSIFMENQGVQPDLSEKDYVLERQLKPEARVDVIQALRERDILPTSMIDISDGLASELLHICKHSEVGCRVDAERLPIDPSTWKTAEELNISAITMALSGGEDYELLFTIDQKDFEKLQELKDIRVIGFITDQAEGCNLIDSDQTMHPIKAEGWNSFGH